MNMGIRLLLVVLSAGLSIAVFPPIGWSAFALIAWFPLLFALREAKPSHALYLGLLHGVVFFSVTMSWVLNIFEESKGIIVPLVLIWRSLRHFLLEVMLSLKVVTALDG